MRDSRKILQVLFKRRD